MSQNVYGCDLSKARIDIHDLGARRDFHIANEAGAIADWLAELPEDARVVFEGEEDQQTIRWIVCPTNVWLRQGADRGAGGGGPADPSDQSAA